MKKKKDRLFPPDWEMKMKWNVKLFRKINNIDIEKINTFYKYFFRLGKTYSLPLFYPIFYITGGKKAVIHLTLSMIITGILMPLIKYTFKHYRPSKLMENVKLLEQVTLKSFPSADSAFAFTLLGSIIFYGNPLLILIFTIYAVAIGIGRVYMGAHFPFDVLVGGLIGFLSGVSGYFIVSHYFTFMR